MENIFHKIDNNPEQARDVIVSFLKGQLGALTGDMTSAIDAAYSIAGLAGTDFVRSLDPIDPIDEIFTIAGELEINPDDSENLRKEIIDKIRSL